MNLAFDVFYMLLGTIYSSLNKCFEKLKCNSNDFNALYNITWGNKYMTQKKGKVKIYKTIMKSV